MVLQTKFVNEKSTFTLLFVNEQHLGVVYSRSKMQLWIRQNTLKQLLHSFEKYFCTDP